MGRENPVPHVRQAQGRLQLIFSTTHVTIIPLTHAYYIKISAPLSTRLLPAKDAPCRETPGTGRPGGVESESGKGEGGGGGREIGRTAIFIRPQSTIQHRYGQNPSVRQGTAPLPLEATHGHTFYIFYILYTVKFISRREASPSCKSCLKFLLHVLLISTANNR